MKVLWLCNIMLPVISEAMKEKVDVYGGWLSGLCDSLAEQDDIELRICFPYSKADLTVTGNTQNLSYCGFKESDQNREVFCTILKSFSPDIIHIWGTEKKHTLDMVHAAEALNMLDRVILNIQGLVSIIGKYHYYCGIPERICKSASLLEIRNKDNIAHGKEQLIRAGRYEIEAIRKVNHVVGRTDWDEACTKQINPDVKYHHCNESLRSSFYAHQWEIGSCERHSIFLSQSNYPIKGFHLMLAAMPLILERYPDAHIYTIGYSPGKPDSWNHWLTYRSYPKYLRELIDKNNLDDHITFVGSLSEKEICRQFLKANVFVSPSSIENSSNSVGEAMLLGMPVVASDVGGIKNLLKHEEEGYLYQWDAPYMLAYYVCKVFEDEDRAAAMGRRARAHASKTHDRLTNLRDMTDVYKQVMLHTDQY